MTVISIKLHYATDSDAVDGLNLIEESIDKALDGKGLKIFDGIVGSETGDVEYVPEFCECGRRPHECLSSEGGDIHGDI